VKLLLPPDSERSEIFEALIPSCFPTLDGPDLVKSLKDFAPLFTVYAAIASELARAPRKCQVVKDPANAVTAFDEPADKILSPLPAAASAHGARR